jgi:hypothetical protein
LLKCFNWAVLTTSGHGLGIEFLPFRFESLALWLYRRRRYCLLELATDLVTLIMQLEFVTSGDLMIKPFMTALPAGQKSWAWKSASHVIATNIT